jgi:hypothetical protein
MYETPLYFSSAIPNMYIGPLGSGKIAIINRSTNNSFSITGVSNINTEAHKYRTVLGILNKVSSHRVYISCYGLQSAYKLLWTTNPLFQLCKRLFSLCYDDVKIVKLFRL